MKVYCRRKVKTILLPVLLVAVRKKLLNFLKSGVRKYIPLQCSITYGNGDVYIDMSCLVDEFTYYSDKVGDIHYSLKASEYKLGSELNSLLKMAAGVRNE